MALRTRLMQPGDDHAPRRTAARYYGRRMLRLVASIVLVGAMGAGCSASGDAAPSASSSASSSAESSADVRSPRGSVIADLVVDRVVDGDTVKVTIDGEQVSVRLIGIDTPETVKPDTEVQCFGPEASAFADQQLTGQRIVLELDDSQGRLDRYDRLLAYVWRVLPDGSLVLFNEEAVAGGFARERQYGDEAYAWRSTLVQAQEAARAAGRGLWAACVP